MDQVKAYQLGNIFLTKTRKYVNPVLRLWGKEFLEHLRKLYVVRSGIGDTYHQKVTGYELHNHIFLLINSELTEADFEDELEFFREHESYQIDYVFDEIKEGNLHMLVLKVPEKFKHALDAFRNSKYSKMYTADELNAIFIDGEVAFKVISKDEKYRFEFQEQLNSKAKDPIPGTEIILPKDAELDSIIKPEVEIFRYS